MADQSDVEMALAAIVANALYPAGAAAASITGGLCRVYRGYPTSPSLDADLAAGVLHVSVAAVAVPARNVTRYARRWVGTAPVPATLTVTVNSQSAVFAGACDAGQLAGLSVNGVLFAYAVQGNDTPATVASNLAAPLSAAGWPVNYAGTSVSVPGAKMFAARVVYGAGALQEIKRQVQDFRISMWCPDPASRDAVAPPIDQVLAAQNFIPLTDGSFARLIFSNSEMQDGGADARLYRRDVTYSAEYPTTLAQITPAMLFGTASLHAAVAFGEAVES